MARFKAVLFDWRGTLVHIPIPLWHVLRASSRSDERQGHPETRGFGELLIDLEEDKAARAVVFGLLAEMERT